MSIVAEQNLPSFDDIGDDHGVEMADMGSWSLSRKLSESLGPFVGFSKRLTGIDVKNRGRHIVRLLGNLRSCRDSALEAPTDAIPARRTGPQSSRTDEL